MTAVQREELRRLQDDFLAAPIIRLRARLYGLHHQLWEDGPTYAEVKNKLFPQHRGVFERIVQAERGPLPSLETA